MGKNNNRNNFRRKEEPKNRINERIRAQEVRLVGDDVEQGIYSLSEALSIADNLGVDLVEISPNANPPVCKAMDYKKFLFEQKKREKEQQKKQRENRVDTKELRFGPNTEDHDFQFKLRHAEKFLKEGNRVKAYVHFKGREIMFKEQGEVLLLKFVQELSDLGVPEGMPKLEGKRMNIFINPKKKK